MKTNKKGKLSKEWCLEVILILQSKWYPNGQKLEQLSYSTATTNMLDYLLAFYPSEAAEAPHISKSTSGVRHCLGTVSYIGFQ